MVVNVRGGVDALALLGTMKKRQELENLASSLSEAHALCLTSFVSGHGDRVDFYRITQQRGPRFLEGA